MRVKQRHDHGEAFVGRTDHPDAAVRFGQVLLVHQPVDRVPGVGDMIDLGRVERADRRAVDDVVALRPIFAADILLDTEIAVMNERSKERSVGKKGVYRCRSWWGAESKK